MKTIYLKALIIISFFLMNAAFTQENNPDTTQLISSKKKQLGLRKNAIYLTGGTLGSTYGFINGSYERMLWGNKNPVMQSIFIRVSIGKYKGEALSGFISFSNYKATTYLATVGGLVGKRSSFFEFSMGFMYANGIETRTSSWTGNENSYGYQETIPAVTLGYRYQKPGGHFIFRMGVGYYELYYIGLGFCL